MFTSRKRETLFERLHVYCIVMLISINWKVFVCERTNERLNERNKKLYRKIGEKRGCAGARTIKGGNGC